METAIRYFTLMSMGVADAKYKKFLVDCVSSEAKRRRNEEAELIKALA